MSEMSCKTDLGATLAPFDRESSFTAIRVLMIVIVMTHGHLG